MRIYFWIIRAREMLLWGADLLSRKGQIVLRRGIETLLGEAISSREIYDVKIDSSFLPGKDPQNSAMPISEDPVFLFAARV